jgi:hypothetical protein
MVQDLEDSLPVVEQLHRQRLDFVMGTVLLAIASRPQAGQGLGVAGGQSVRGRVFPRSIHRRPQSVQGLQSLAAEGLPPLSRIDVVPLD